MTRPKQGASADCEACDGTGWTEAGWAAKPSDFEQCRGDCPACGGTGYKPAPGYKPVQGPQWQPHAVKDRR